MPSNALKEYTRKGYFDTEFDGVYIAAVRRAGYTLKEVKSRGIVYVIEWEGGCR